MKNAFKQRFSNCFSSSFFNTNKFQFKLINNSAPNKFKINFSNKFFMSQMLNLNSSYKLALLMNSTQTVGGGFFNGALYISSEDNLSLNGSETDLFGLQGDSLSNNEERMWTCDSVVAGPTSRSKIKFK